jgi:AraC-like DNA-binding protein
MKQELGSAQASQNAVDESSVVYTTLARSILAREYENIFLDATGLPVQLVPGGEMAWPFPVHKRGNPFCSLMAQFPSSCAACRQAHTELQKQVADSLTPQVVSCFAGLMEFAVPIVVSGQHVATLLGGQIFLRNPTQAQFARLAERLRTWKIEPELQRVEMAFFQTRVTSQKQFQASVRLVTIFAKFLAEDVNRNLLAAHEYEGPCVNVAKHFILAHASEPLRLRDVAEHVHVSTHYFSKFFKKAAGIGFSEFLTRIRVENAKNKLANSLLPVNEIADEVGFGSLSQFNRAFHRYVGCSPRQYRASLPEARSF